MPLTPHTLGDISGFEDILEADHRCSLERRPSMAPERARSQPAPALDQCIAAAAASLHEAAAGGPPAVTRAAQARAAGPAAGAAAAAGQAAAPRVVHVPWQAKPLAHALSTGADPSPLGSPQKPALQAAPAVSSSWGSGFASGASSLGLGSPGSPPAGPAALPSSGSKDAGAGGSGQKQAGCAGGAGGLLPPARPAKAAGQRRWDLSFCSASLEAQFRCAHLAGSIPCQWQLAARGQTDCAELAMAGGGRCVQGGREPAACIRGAALSPPAACSPGGTAAVAHAFAARPSPGLQALGGPLLGARRRFPGPRPLACAGHRWGMGPARVPAHASFESRRLTAPTRVLSWVPVRGEARAWPIGQPPLRQGCRY